MEVTNFLQFDVKVKLDHDYMRNDMFSELGHHYFLLITYHL